MSAVVERRPLTDAQREVLKTLILHWISEQRWPTLHELCDTLGWRSHTSSLCHLTALAKKGYIRLTEGRARGIEVIGLSEAIEDAALSHMEVLLTEANA